MKRLGLLLCLLLTGVSCTGPGRPPPPKTQSASPGRASGTAVEPSPVVRARVVLRAELDERPAPWKRIAFVPFGPREEQLGRLVLPEGLGSQPSAIAVASDGSFWIDDRWKNRVAHYSGRGRYLGSIGGLRERGWDLAVVGNQVVALARTASDRLAVAEPGGSGVGSSEFRVVEATVDGAPLSLIQVVSSPLGLVAQSGGLAGTGRSEFGAFVLIRDPASGRGERVPGLPVGDGHTFFDADSDERPSGQQQFRLTFASPGLVSVHPLRVDLIARHGGVPRSVPAIVGLLEPLPVGDDVVMYVQVSPSRPTDAEHLGGGRWLLRVGRDPLLWERLPQPGISDELQHRHLAVGPGGAIYLMAPQPAGMVIMRRP